MDAILSESFDDGNSEKRRNAHEVNGIEKHILTGINVEKTDDVFTEGTIDNDKVVNDGVDTAANVSGEVNKERIHEKPEEDEAAVDGLNNYNASNGDGGEHVNNLEKASDVDGTLVKELRADKQENCKETAEAKTSVKVNKKRNKIRKKKALRIDEILSESFDDGNQEKGQNAYEVDDIEKNIASEINVARTKNVFAQEGTVDDDKVVNDGGEAATNISGEGNEERINGKLEEDALVKGLDNNNAITGDEREHVNNVEKASNADDALECKEDKHEIGEETAEVKISVKVKKKRNSKKKALQILSGVATINNAQKPEAGIDELASKEPIRIDTPMGIDQMSVEKASNVDDALVKECKEDKHENGEEIAVVETSVKLNKKRKRNRENKVLEILSGVATINNAQKPETGIDESARKEPIRIDTPIGIDKTSVEKASNADGTLVKECNEEKHENGEVTAEVKTSVKVNKKRNKIKKKKALEILSGVATINNAQKPETGIDELASKEPVGIDTPIGIDKTSLANASNADGTLVKECKEDKLENGEETAEVKISVKVNKKRNKIKKEKALQILSGLATINNTQKPETGIDELASKEPIRIDTPIGIDKASVKKASNADDTLVKEGKEDKHENGEETAEVKIPVKVNEKRNKIKKKKALQILSGVATRNNAQKPETSIDELASKEPIGIDTLGKNKDIPIVSGVATVEDAQKPGSGNDELASKEPIGIDKPAVEHEDVPKGANKSNSSKDGKLSEKNDCTGMIFLCNSDTKKDCHLYRVIGMPFHMKDLVTKGMRLFLFDVDLRMMYGIYWASGPGRFNIEPRAFNLQFPCQVRFYYVVNCKPLAEELFREVLKEFHYTPTDYIFPLNQEQVANLCKLFVENTKKCKHTKAPVTISSAKAASGNKVAAAESSSAQLDRKRKREKDSHLEQKRSRLTCEPSVRLYAEYYRAAENHPPAHLYRS